jgi:Flp pilus assembly protein TadG
MGADGRRRARMRNRRGAIVVMTGIFIVALMMLAAITVDASRIFAAKNELQTASDAAALAGALQLLEDSSVVIDSARAYALRNRVEQDVIDSVEVEYGVWSVAAETFIAGGDPADAVRVTTRHALPLSLARVFGDSTVTVTTSAVAWSSAPVAASSCAKPLAVPYSELMRTLNYPEGFEFDLTDDDIRTLREMSENDRETHFHFGDSDLGSDTTEHYRRAQYFPVDIDSTWNRSDPLSYDRPPVDGNTFKSYVVGPPAGRCSRSVSPDDSVRSEPGDKRDALREGLSDICQRLGGSFTGSTVLRCVSTDDGSNIGIPLKVILWSGEAATWHNANRARVQAKMTGSFVMTEFKWDPSDSSGTGQHGRMAGHWNVTRAFGPLSLSSASTLLRPILVR